MVDGKSAERMFYELMLPTCKNIRRATKDEDIFEHWDFDCDGVKYDVKTQKRKNREDKEVASIIWIELLNVRGAAGWLIGKADKIAFLQDQEFVIVDRAKLFETIKQLIPNHEPLRTKEYKKWYRRSGRWDKITYIHPEDIEHIIERRIKL